MPQRRQLALLALAISLLLTGCATSSRDQIPVIETQTIKERVPAPLVADIPPPSLPAKIATQDDKDAVLLAVTAWATSLRARLTSIRAWNAAP